MGYAYGDDDNLTPFIYPSPVTDETVTFSLKRQAGLPGVNTTGTSSAGKPAGSASGIPAVVTIIVVALGIGTAIRLKRNDR